MQNREIAYECLHDNQIDLKYLKAWTVMKFNLKLKKMSDLEWLFVKTVYILPNKAVKSCNRELIIKYAISLLLINKYG